MPLTAYPNFLHGRAELDTPFCDFEAVTPADGSDLPLVARYGCARGLSFTGAGNVVLVNAFGDERTLAGWPPDTLLPLKLLRIKATGTTATGLTAWY